MKPSLRALISLLVAGLVGACAQDGGRRRAMPVDIEQALQGCDGWGDGWYPNPPSTLVTEKEEELFGRIIGAPGLWSVSLLPRDAATASNQPGYAGFNPLDLQTGPIVPVNFAGACTTPGQGHHNANTAHWGWYATGPAFAAQCDISGNQTENDPERHRHQGLPFPQAYESHCLSSGRFYVDVESGTEDLLVLRRPVDFLPSGPGPGVPGVGEIEDPGPITGKHASADVIFDHDEGSSVSITDDSVEISVVQNRLSTTWSPVSMQNGYYRGPKNFHFRFSARHTTVSSGDPTKVLVRYFWEHPVVTDRTGFTNARFQPSPSGPIRVKQFATTGSRTVRAHFVQAHQRPSNPLDETSTNYGVVRDLPIDVYGDLTAVISATHPRITGQPVTLSASGSNGAGSNTYLWTVKQGSSTVFTSTSNPASWTPAMSGPYTIDLRKGDLYNNAADATLVPPPCARLATFAVTPSAPVSVTSSGSYPLNGSANDPANSWDWDRSFDGGSTWQQWSTSQNSSFPTSTGLYEIRWRLAATRNCDPVVGTGFATTSVSIPTSPPYTVTGTAPAIVSVKTTYSLAGSASHPSSSWHWDRSLDGGTTWSLWSNSQNSSFIPSAGCYFIHWRLVATRSSDGAIMTCLATTCVNIQSPGCSCYQ